jgi:hypothetical protein
LAPLSAEPTAMPSALMPNAAVRSSPKGPSIRGSSSFQIAARSLTAPAIRPASLIALAMLGRSDGGRVQAVLPRERTAAGPSSPVATPTTVALRLIARP